MTDEQLEQPIGDGFTSWLLEQRDRDDPVGDLARDAGVDPKWPGDVVVLDLLFHVGSWGENSLKTAYAEFHNQK